uniref:patellin-6-like n=1 Tax=Erigeron canadensis TaxID=72917 RepID=UPI001CB97C51|nr:patellin-6-like [Erigeron canadensis]
MEDLVMNISEKKAVEELKDMLACRFKNDEEEAVSLWGIPLIANPSQAADQFPEFKQLENVTTYIHGFDRQGHPVYYHDYTPLNTYQHLSRKLLETDENIDKFNKWRLQVLERGIRMHPGRINSVVLAYDYSTIPTEELMDADYDLYKILINNYYPGMVSYTIAMNEPWYVLVLFFIRRILFTCFSLFGGDSLLKLGKRGQVFETLCKYIKPEYISIQYGGLMDGGEQVSEITAKGGEKSDKGVEAQQTTASGMWNILQRLSWKTSLKSKVA